MNKVCKTVLIHFKLFHEIFEIYRVWSHVSLVSELWSLTITFLNMIKVFLTEGFIVIIQYLSRKDVQALM